MRVELLCTRMDSVEVEAKPEAESVLFVGQTFDAKYRMNDCKYTTTANRKVHDSTEGLYNEAHKYAYAKLTCVLGTHGKPKRTNETGEQSESRFE